MISENDPMDCDDFSGAPYEAIQPLAGIPNSSVFSS
jgi:hypothetical protein